MILGEIIARCEVRVVLSVRGPSGDTEDVPRVLDTGFSGFLVLPRRVVARLRLPQTDVEEATLADGSVTRFAVHEAEIDWDGDIRTIAAYAAEDAALLGIALLDGCLVTMDFMDSHTVTIETQA